MSGDVQPRKRKDKKKKKDELSLDEPRGTAAALGEGDVLMHSYHDHGTGGHWCAKIIFFSLLAVLITLIGLIILENRGLSELEANAVESRYSGILEGWLEDAPDDDHHDAHTLELKHHDDDENDIGNEDEEENEDDHGDDEDEHDDDEDEHDDDEEHDNEDEYGAGDEEDENEDQDEDEDNDEQDSQQDLDDEDDDDTRPYKYYDQDEDDDKEEKEEDEQNEQNEQNEYEQDEIDNETEDNEDNNESNELDNEDDAENYNAGRYFEDEPDETPSNDDEETEDKENEDEHDDEDEDEEDDDNDELEVEKIEQEASEEDQEPISVELPALPEEEEADDGKDDDDDANESQDDDDAKDDVDEADDGDSQGDDDFLEADDVPPIVERITAPAGKPYVEVEEDDDSTEKPPDTLEEEEEYEKKQEELRKEEEQSSHMWLKLSVGGALLLATHAVMRRATAPRDEAEEERISREATPIDRRMTLIPEEVTPPVIPKKVNEPKKPIAAETVRQAPVFRAPPPPVTKPESEDEEMEEPEEFEEEDDEKAELYSDEEEEQIIIPQRAAPKRAEPPKPDPEPEPEPEPEDEVPDDVEIIDDEQIEEEELSEEGEEEEEISDVDDAELLNRLEAKYGRLPEPEQAGQRHSNLEDGGNSVDDDWSGEPADAFWRDQLDSAEQQLRQGAWSAAMERANSVELQRSARAKYIIAASLDRMAEAQRDNRLLSRAIAAYLEVLKMSDSLSDRKLLDVAKRTLDRIQFRGMYLSAEPVYRLLIRRFPDEPGYRNNLTISFLMANRVDLAESVLKETLAQWPNDRVALAHYGFVLKVNNNKLEEAVGMFEKALEGDKGPACEPRFYYHYGDALLLLGRFKEAHEVHKRGAKHGHFLSPAQRSLYNVPRLKGKPWWNVEETPYLRLAKSLEKSWRDILKEGEAAKALYEKEKEGLKERGEWSQMDLFVQGQEIPGRCKNAPVTCSIVKSEVAAAGCRRGQVKFSAMAAGTHVRPHVGPTNCRLRMHLGLSNTKDTYIRVDQEIRQWQEGKVLLFDDSFEHEVWHNGTGKRMVLIVDVWHPELTPQERRTLPAI